MAGVDVGGASGGRRQVTSDLNMVPFIDLLFVTIAFLLITAVWTTSSRMNVDSQVGSTHGPPIDTPPSKVLHVHLEGDAVRLVWKLDRTVLSEERVDRKGVAADGTSLWGSGDDSLRARIAASWKAHGDHKGEGDPKQDAAVLHVADTAPHRDIITMLDAVAQTKRAVRIGGSTQTVSAMVPSLATR